MAWWMREVVCVTWRSILMLSQRPYLVMVNDLWRLEPHHPTMSWAGYIHFLARLFRLSDHIDTDLRSQ